MEALLWLAIMIICIIVEIATLGLTCIWFGFGAIVAFIASLFGAPLPVQIVLFFAVSIITLVFTRPVAKKWLNKGTVKTNYQSVIGKKVKITERVDNLSGTGAGIVDGQEWTVRSSDDRIILEAGEIVSVAEIKGVKIIAERIKEN